MIDRYTRPQMAAVWDEHTKLGHWLRIEILATECRAGKGLVPAEDLETIKAKAAFDVERVKQIERKTRHTSRRSSTTSPRTSDRRPSTCTTA
ncbi:MAG TPA: hypothetical protein VHL54_05420 [Actinomycetota bacterium]|nr:hypothetical protein [Actinomycetota bacterium]